MKRRADRFVIRMALAQLRRRPARYIGLLLTAVEAEALTVAAAAIGLTIRQTVDRTFAAPYASANYTQTVEGFFPEVPVALSLTGGRLRW